MVEFHPVTEIFPLMQGEQYDQLVQDIHENDLREAIWLHPDKRIIDGRNRHRACVDAGVDPRFRTWDGEGSLIQFVVSLNLHRRHLTSSQRAAAAAEALEQLKIEAKERQREGGKTKVRQKFAEAPDAGRATAQAAKMFGTNRTYVAEAAKLRDEDQSTFKAIVKGDFTISEMILVKEYLSLGTEADRIAALELDAADRVMLARIAKQANSYRQSKYDRQTVIKRVLDELEAAPGRTLKQVTKQVRREITAAERDEQQQCEEREKRVAEEKEREWQEREPFEHFAELLLGKAPGLGAYERDDIYERLIRHLKNCKLTKLTKAVERLKAEWGAEDEQISA